MSDIAERESVDEIVLEDDGSGWGDDPFTPAKLVGVAVAGALVALAAYYAYAQLDPEKRETLKDSLMAMARSQVRRWTEGQDEPVM